MGRPHVKETVKVTLDPNDILFFNTSTCLHWSAQPILGTVVSDRVMVVLSGYKKVVVMNTPPGETESADDMSI